MEIWKDIQGYEGLYQVSNLGRVINFKSKKIKCFSLVKGYCLVLLSKNGKTSMKRVHRLVAESFINNNNLKEEVNHIDGNKLNNNVENLEWCNHSENMLHSYKNNLHKRGLKICKRGLESPFIIKVDQYDLKGNYIKTWNSLKEVENELNIFATSISKCCRGKVYTAGKYIWKYTK